VILAIDTATQAIGIALHDGSRLIAEHYWIVRGFHGVQLAPETALMLRHAGCKASSLSAVAVAQGPGSFTGLRIGMAMGKGIALVHSLPMIGVPTHDILAYSQPRRSESMLAVIHAGRGRVAGIWYKWISDRWRAIGAPEVLTWDGIMEVIKSPTYLCGEIDGPIREALRNEPLVILAPPAFCLRRPGFLAEIAWERIRKGKADDPGRLAPIYLPTEGLGRS
jgi:tRNA threonylcarbamoyladenosine biosynthesis protein TsaB